MPEDQPLFRVLRGTPTAEELAALVGAILVRSRPAAGRAPLGESGWARSARLGAVTGRGLPARRGPAGWRAAMLPR